MNFMGIPVIEDAHAPPNVTYFMSQRQYIDNYFAPSPFLHQIRLWHWSCPVPKTARERYRQTRDGKLVRVRTLNAAWRALGMYKRLHRAKGHKVRRDSDEVICLNCRDQALIAAIVEAR